MTWPAIFLDPLMLSFAKITYYTSRLHKNVEVQRIRDWCTKFTTLLCIYLKCFFMIKCCDRSQKKYCWSSTSDHKIYTYLYFSHFKHSFWKQRRKCNQDCPNDLCLSLIDHRRKKIDKKWKEKLCNNLWIPYLAYLPLRWPPKM